MENKTEVVKSIVSVLACKVKWDIKIGHYIPLTDNNYQDYYVALERMEKLAEDIYRSVSK